ADLIQGNPVDLLSFHKAGGDKWNKDFTIPLYSFGIPEIVSININALIQASLSWDYAFGFGIDTTGFYIDPTTHIGLGGSISAGLSGSLTVLGLPLASAGGTLGVS